MIAYMHLQQIEVVEGCLTEIALVVLGNDHWHHRNICYHLFARFHGWCCLFNFHIFTFPQIHFAFDYFIIDSPQSINYSHDTRWTQQHDALVYIGLLFSRHCSRFVLNRHVNVNTEQLILLPHFYTYEYPAVRPSHTYGICVLCMSSAASLLPSLRQNTHIYRSVWACGILKTIE